MDEPIKRSTLIGLVWRAKVLITGLTEWTDPTGEIDVTRSRKIAWLVAGPHSRNWKWVQRWGAMPCGCTRNPVTRRLVLINGRCPEHSNPRLRRRLEQNGVTEEPDTGLPVITLGHPITSAQVADLLDEGEPSGFAGADDVSVPLESVPRVNENRADEVVDALDEGEPTDQDTEPEQ